MAGTASAAIAALIGIVCALSPKAATNGAANGNANGAAERARVTRVHIAKGAHTMDLLEGDRVVKTYRVAIGPGGRGAKTHEGDEVTPVGRYHVLQRTPSRYRVFMRLDYPNADDRSRFARLKASGELPRAATIGGDIGIHGAPPQAEWKSVHKLADWTLGCIAVDDAEIDEVAAMVKDGTVVDIDD